jgi:hypothetical protein
MVEVVVIALLAACPKPPLPAETLDRIAVRGAQRVKVSRLQKGLPDVALKTWLHRELGPRVALIWQPGDCGVTGEGDPGRCDWPLCTDIRATLPSGTIVELQLSIGTQVEGAIGPPELAYYEVLDRHRKHVRVYSLASVPGIVRELEAKGGDSSAVER